MRTCELIMSACTRDMRSYTSGTTSLRAMTALSRPNAATRDAAASTSAKAQPSRKRSCPVVGCAHARAHRREGVLLTVEPLNCFFPAVTSFLTVSHAGMGRLRELGVLACMIQGGSCAY